MANRERVTGGVRRRRRGEDGTSVQRERIEQKRDPAAGADEQGERPGERTSSWDGQHRTDEKTER